MLIYSKDEILDISNFKYFDEGTCAKLYFQDNIVLKIYKINTKNYYYFSKKIFNELKELNLDSIVKLYNYYYEDTNKLTKLLPPRFYTMEFINNPNIILIEQTKEYLLDIISSIEKDVITLTKNKIKIYDTHHRNIIFMENSAKIIDIDLFSKNNLISYKKLLLQNKKLLLYYIISTIEYELKKNNMYTYLYETLFKYNDLINLSVTDYLDNLLNEGTIQDYIEKKIKIK